MYHQNQIYGNQPESLSDSGHEHQALESQANRAKAIAAEIASLRRQGVEPVPEFSPLAERYVLGELSLDQLTEAIKGLRRRR
jgi:hypothetical protein